MHRSGKPSRGSPGISTARRTPGRRLRAGSLAVRLTAGRRRRLRAPAPLETQLREVGDGRHMEFWDGQTLIAEASAVDVVPDPILFIDIERACIAGRGYPGAVPNSVRNVLQLRPGAPRRARHRPGSGVRRVGRLRPAAARPGREGMDLVGSGLRHRLAWPLQETALVTGRLTGVCSPTLR